MLYLPLGQSRLDGRPGLTLRSITEQIHDDSPLLNRLVHFKQILAGLPSILLGFTPRRAVFAHADDDIQPVVSKIQALAVPLRAIPDQREGIILEVVL